MRTRRLKARGCAVYHCMSRTVNGAYLFGDREKEVLRRMMWQVADFSGVQILTYALMDNHFHILVRVPARVASVGFGPTHSGAGISDAELMRRWRRLYPRPTKYETASAAVMEKKLAEDGEEAERIRSRLLLRMHDVSEFMKTLKQRFTIWMNHAHGRYGTLWAERFKSVLVEGRGRAMQTMAAYIDLNPVRAGIVEDPKDYRFCGYAEAIAHSMSSGVSAGRGSGGSAGGGGQPEPDRPVQSVSPGPLKKKRAGVSAWSACDGICAIWKEYSSGPSSLRIALQMHREFIFGKRAGEAGLPDLAHSRALQVLEKEKGQLPRATVLRCRVRYFTDGVVLGTENFVRGFIERQQRETRQAHRPKPVRLRGTDWEGLANLRPLRQQVFG
ncbi:MAG: transposase [Opitutales bacterium]